jgi:excisionase family DNA binding protein
MAVITISRELGSQGSLVARELATTLGVDWVDAAMLARAIDVAAMADTSMVDRERLLSKPDADATLVERVAKLILVGHPAFGLKTKLDDEAYFQLAKESIRALADQGDIVIIGRGGNLALADRPEVLKIQLVAPVEVRVAEVAERETLSESEAQRRIRESDRQRCAFIKQAFGVDWDNPLLYDLVINTAGLDLAGVVSIIVCAAGFKAAGKPTLAKIDDLRDLISREYYTVDEISSLLGLSKDLIRHAVFYGDLPAIRAGATIYRISREDLLNWLAKLE